ncbi:MAG: hypothetical protein GY906_10440 [bacterium]|nr:hypothetical protein [bacterium]
MSTVIVGTTAVERATFRDADGALADPDTVVAAVKKPDESVTSVGLTVTQIGTGIYDVGVPTDDAGLWYLKVTGTGPGSFAKVLEARICVVRSSVA